MSQNNDIQQFAKSHLQGKSSVGGLRDFLEYELKSTISNFCDAIGCKQCPLNKGTENPCKASELQSELMELDYA